MDSPQDGENACNGTVNNILETDIFFRTRICTKEGETEWGLLGISTQLIHKLT